MHLHPRHLWLLSAFLHLSTAVNVYLSPQPSVGRGRVSLQEAGRVVSQHLGLEMFEPMVDASKASSSFVGQGQKSSILVSVEATDLQAVLPTAKPTLKFATQQPVSSDLMSSTISDFATRAKHLFAVVNDVVAPARLFLNGDSLPSLPLPTTSKFSAIDLSGLSSLRSSYGTLGKEYQEAVATTRAYLEEAQKRDDIQLAILSFSPPNLPSRPKRQANVMQSQFPLPPDHAPPQSPIGAISTCFFSEEACNNSTSTCSGRGQCVKATKGGTTCFECTCGVTKTGEGNQMKTRYWVGESCEREDISSQFVLFVGITILLLFLVVGSVSLLVSVGEIPLPSTLLSSAVAAKRD